MNRLKAALLPAGLILLALVGALYVWASVSDAPYRLGDWAAR